MFEICQEIGLRREQTIIWNIVPWYIGSGTKIRPAKRTDIDEGYKYIGKLLDLLPNLRTIVLLGLKAHQIREDIEKSRPDICVIESYHPSPLFINRRQENRQMIIEALGQIRL
jgi:uracil-DNA glycosylase